MHDIFFCSVYRYLDSFRLKLGLIGNQEEDELLIQSFLWVSYTNSATPETLNFTVHFLTFIV